MHVVVGGSGYIGRHLLRALVARRASCLILDPAKAPPALASLPHLKTNVSSVRASDLPAVVDAVYYLAAMNTAVVETPEAQVSRAGEADELRACVRLAEICGAKRLVYASSAAVYGPEGKKVSSYAALKAEGERVVKAAHGINVRIHNVIGCDLDLYDHSILEKQRLPSAVVRALRQRPHELTLRRRSGAGAYIYPVRRFVRVQSVASAFADLASGDVSSTIFDVASVDAVSLDEIRAGLARRFGVLRMDWSALREEEVIAPPAPHPVLSSFGSAATNFWAGLAEEIESARGWELSKSP